jgi:polyisoprenoid-binding protein YceI
MKKVTFLLLVLAFAAFGTANAAEWKFDKAHSAIKFKVKHLLTNTWGEFKDYNGTISYDPENLDATKVIVTINPSSIDTENEKRDGHLRSPDFFDVETFPEMKFVSKGFRKTSDGAKIDGYLTIHGVTKEVTLDVEGPSAPINFMGMTKIAASATTTINRTDFGLTWNKTLEAGNLLVGEDVTIMIDVELDKVE